MLSTPQIDLLSPLGHVNPAAGEIRVRSAVVTVADPLETNLGRAFDIQLSALIRAFHNKDYVLDGFALTWRWRRPTAEQRGSRIPADGTASFAKQQRGRPSVLVFRKDLWRGSTNGDDGTEYFVVFLVGESPTFGVHPRAFKTAATFAATLDGARDKGLLSSPCNGKQGALDAAAAAQLQIIGPTFSGSMNSIALVLGDLLKHATGLTVELRSPSATVESNEWVEDWTERIAGASSWLHYTPLAINLKQQLKILAAYASDQSIDGKVVILAEESTFGRGIYEVLEDEKKSDNSPDTWRKFVEDTRVTTFPQNIAAIRAEHARIDKQKSESLRNLTKTQSSLLELDLTDVDEITDRPPAYRRALSSRSDELMLYRTFDALRVYVKPRIVVIVATDIRDRLFLLNEVRKSLPTALPVLMESDFLTAHPDYRKISRGAIVIPNGPTLLCVEKEGHLTSCTNLEDVTKKEHAKKLENLKKEYAGRSYLAFPSDYAANMFRGAFDLIEPNQRNGPQAFDPGPIAPLVKTMAGFQELPVSQNSNKNLRSTFLAADGRILLERPTAVFFLVSGTLIFGIALWLRRYSRAHLVLLSPLRHLNPFTGVREAAYQQVGSEGERILDAERMPARLSRWCTNVLLVLGTTVFFLAGIRLFEVLLSEPSARTWLIAHGRDLLALSCLFLVYICVAIIATWRMYLWQRRCRGHLRALVGVAQTSSPALQTCNHGGLEQSALLCFFTLLMFLAFFRGWPVSVDAVWPAMIFDITLLCLGISFLTELWSQSRLLARLAQLLAPTADLPADPSAAGPDFAAGSPSTVNWASPLRLHALPQSPFSLHFRKRDLAALLAYPDETWRAQTRQLLEGAWPFEPESDSGFRAWQARLVAELRYGIVAIRSCAWSAILAPTTILLGMGLYPPFSERMMTTASVTLIFIAFALVMYVVIKLERHPLLGRMFTQHGDGLSIGGVIGALWGKLIAAAVILIPVLFPDVLSGLHGLLQSIDSLQ